MSRSALMNAWKLPHWALLVGVWGIAFGVEAQAPQPEERASELATPVLTEPDRPLDLMTAIRGQGVDMNAEQAASQALRTAPTVASAQASARQARAAAERAMYQLIPQTSITARYTRLSDVQNGSLVGGGGGFGGGATDALIAGVDDPEARLLWNGLFAAFANSSVPVFLDQIAFQASISIPVSDLFLTLWPAWDAAQSAADATEAQTDTQQNEVAFSAREAFFNFARARGAQAIAELAENNVEARLRQVHAFVEAGAAAPVDELRLEAQRASARVAVAQARGGVSIAEQALRTLLHDRSNAPIAIAEDILSPLPPLAQSVERLTEIGQEGRPEVRGMERMIVASEQQVQAAEGSRYPHLAIAANLYVANPNQRIFPPVAEFRETWDLSAVLTWSPNDLLNGERQADEGRARRDQSEADLRAIRDGIRVQVVEAYYSYASHRQAFEAAAIGVRAAEESYRVQVERYRAGSATMTEVIDSTTAQVQAQLEMLNAAIDARLAIARLRRAIGQEPELTGTP